MRKLINCFVQCKCGEDLRMDEIDQVRICTCGNEVRFVESVKKYLRKEYADLTELPEPIEANALA